MNAATEVKRHKLTQEDCDIARFFTRRGMKLKEIGKIIGVDPSTVGKIQKADFRLETYLEQRKEMNRKTAENKAAREEEHARRMRQGLADEDQGNIDNSLMIQSMAKKPESRWPTLPPSATWLMGEEPKYMQPQEVQGQMKMDLDQQAEEPEKHDDSKQMKFQAAMVDKLVKVLTEMIVTLDNRLTALDEIRDVLKGGAGNE